jgi:heavy metal sensor kinase
MWYCVTLTLAMFLLGVLMYWIVAFRLLRRQDALLLKKADRILAILQQPGGGRPLTNAQKEALDHLGQNIVVHESQGSRKVQYQSPEMQANPLAPSLAMLGWAEGPDRQFTTLPFKGETWRVIAEPYRAGDDRQGVLQVVGNLEDVQDTLTNLRFAILLLVPAGILCSAMGGFWLAGRALAPVGRIASMAREIEASKLDQRLPHPGVDDEIGRLVMTLNRMIARLESSFDSMKRFTADASHELRNPLATMRNTIDVTLEQPRTADQQRAALESLGEDVDRLRRIVEDLLLLARADNGRIAMNRERVRLDSLVQALAEIQQPRAQELGVAVALASGPAEVNGDERWLYQMVGNLLDNALKFAGAGGKVLMEVTSQGDTVRLRVSDSGPGIPDEDLERIFERFYQVDPSRAQRTGSGLGLAIAAWIVQVHEGRISAANHPGGGAVFTVELPAAAIPGGHSGSQG